MKICVILERFYPFKGGRETRWFEICRRLALKHEVHVYTAWGDVTAPKFPWGILAENEEVEGINIHRVGKAGSKRFEAGTRSILTETRYGLGVALKLTREKFDIYDFDHFPIMHIPLVRPVARSRAVITWHEVWGDVWRTYKGLGKLGKEIEHVVSKLGWHKHIAVSKFTAERLSRIHGIPQRRIRIIPNGVDEVFFGSHEKEDGKIVFVGRLVPQKHAHDLLLDAFLEAKKEDSSLSLHIIGDGPSMSSLRVRAKDVRDVHIYGEISKAKLVYHLKSSCVMCLPSEREGQGIAALEAMAAGVPVVTTNFPLNAIAHEIIINDFNGYVYRPNSKAIAKGILRANSKCRSLSQNCSRFARNFTWDEAAKKTEQLYLELTKR